MSVYFIEFWGFAHMKIIDTIHFGIQRKIVSNMTTESWQTIPHATYIYEADVTDFFAEYKKLNAAGTHKNKITFNTLMLRTICEGIKNCPVINSHIQFQPKLVRGRVDIIEDINISMPMLLPNGEMMTINLHDFGKKNLDEMTDYISDVGRRAKNTDLTEAMFEVSLDNTLTALKKGHILKTIYRLAGAKTGKHRVKTLSGKAKKEYLSIPDTDRITKRDIEQGTITITNVGSVYRNMKGAIALLEIIPPQIAAIAICSVQDRVVPVQDDNGNMVPAVRKVLPLCIAFDHRAIDFAELVPFFETLDKTFEQPSVIQDW